MQFIKNMFNSFLAGSWMVTEAVFNTVSSVYGSIALGAVFFYMVPNIAAALWLTLVYMYLAFWISRTIPMVRRLIVKWTNDHKTKARQKAQSEE